MTTTQHATVGLKKSRSASKAKQSKVGLKNSAKATDRKPR
jgi:hypothetical protein